MDEREILTLLQRHEEAGLEAALEQYGTRLRLLAVGIVGAEAAEECVNDALLSAWNAIPPLQPQSLYAYLCKLTRNMAFNRYHAQKAQKRGGGTLTLSLEELSECLPGSESPAQEAEAAALSRAISDFLRMQSKRARNVFLGRYFYAMTLKEIADRFGMRENTVKTSLHRTRQGLRSYLEQEAFL